MITSYIVVPFATGPRGKLTPGRTQNLADQARAVRAAERLAASTAGVVVLKQDADPATDFFAEPQIVFQRGEVPAEMTELLGA